MIGHIYAEVKIYNKKLTKTKKLTLLVDNGSTYTWIKEKTLKEFNITPIREITFKKIDGTCVSRYIGEAVIEIEDRKITTIVVFGKDGDEEVLGLYSLEGLGFEIDSVNKKLKKSNIFLAI